MPDRAEPQKITIRDADGMVTEEATMLDGVLEGETMVYAAGHLRARLQFHGGSQNGPAIFYDDAGQVMTKANYAGGKRHGESMHFGANGKLIRKEEYQQGLLHGHTIDYYPSGKPREVSSYKDNVLDGEMIRLTEDGKVAERLYYRRGRQQAAPPPAKPKLMAHKPAERRG